MCLVTNYEIQLTVNHWLNIKRKLLQINVWSRTKKNAEKLAGEVGGTAYDSVQEAVKDADVIVTVTSSSTPVLMKDWVKPGAHVNGRVL